MKSILKAKFNLNIKNVLIFVAFFGYAFRFAYMYFNRPFVQNELFSSSMITASVNNKLTDLMLVVVVVSFFLLAIISLKKSKKLNTAFMCVGLLFMFGIFWTLISMFDKSLIRLIVASPTPVIILMAICVYIGYDERMWHSILYAISLSCIFFSFFAIYDSLRFYLEYGQTARLTVSGAMYGTVTAVLMMYVNLFMNPKVFTKQKTIMFLEIISLIVSAIILQSRSWLIHTIILMCIYVYKVSKQSVNKHLVRLMFVVLIGLIIIVAMDSLTMISEGLLDRMDTDSRSEQLNAFFSQTDFLDLFLGRGIDASYYCFGTNYLYLDNLVLLNMFKFGTIPTILYLYLLLKPVVYGIVHKKSQVRNSVVFLLAWFAAMLGLSIYVSYGNNIYNFIVYIVIGRMMYQIEQEKK